MQDVCKSLFTILAHFIGNAHPLMNTKFDYLKIIVESVITDTFGEVLFQKLDILQGISESLAFLLLQFTQL